MSRILDIGHNDLRLFFKSPTAYIWLFAVPTAFIYFMGAAMRGPGDAYDRHPPILIKNADRGYLSSALLDSLKEGGLWVVDPTNADKATVTLEIPSNFTEQVLAGKQSRIQYIPKHKDAEADAALVQARLVRTLVVVNGYLIEAAGQNGTLAGLNETNLRAIMARKNPVALESHFAGRKPVPSGFNFSLPGNLVTYLMMNVLIFGGATMASGRRNGVIRRLMTSAPSRTEIVMGKIYGNTLLGIAQVIFFLTLGKFVFHINLGANLPGVLLILLILSWVAGSLGVLIGSVVAAEDRVVAICVLSSLIMGALGGGWWPLEIAPPIFKTVALFFPTGWALVGLHKMISFGSGIDAAMLPSLVLIGFGTAATGMAVRFFRI